MTGKPLFVYGTLRDPDVLLALLGRVLTAAQCVDAHAPGFRTVHYPQRVYPALVPAPTSSAPGLLLLGLTTIDLTILDAFEGGEYRRGDIAVLTRTGMVHAHVYLPVISIPLDAAPWSLHDWTTRHKEAVIESECGAAAALRDRFTAAHKP